MELVQYDSFELAIDVDGVAELYYPLFGDVVSVVVDDCGVEVLDIVSHVAYQLDVPLAA